MTAMLQCVPSAPFGCCSFFPSTPAFLSCRSLVLIPDSEDMPITGRCADKCCVRRGSTHMPLTKLANANAQALEAIARSRIRCAEAFAFAFGRGCYN